MLDRRYTNVFVLVVDFIFTNLHFHQIPAWVLVLAAIGLFVYQTLDACDGKQARRTGNSSSLGELFDHGCDAVSTSKCWLSCLENSFL